LKAKTEEAQQLNKTNNFKKAEELSFSVLEKCTEFTEVKKLYIECLLQNNKPNEVIHFIRDKLNDEEKVMEDFDYYTAKALYFNSD
jgi:thioredoxin-like negative regulator of GroEL